MGFNTFNAADSSGSGLARHYGIGEVADFTGVPQAYQASDSFWMQSGTWMARGLVPEAVRSMLAAASMTGSLLIGLASPVQDAVATNASWLSASVPPATLPGGITVFQTRADGQIMLIDADGPRMIHTGLTGKVAVISDGATLWAFGTTGTVNTAPGVAKSVDGKTWVLQAISGWPATATMRTNLYPCTTENTPSSTAQGYRNAAWDAANPSQSAVFWTGTRCMAIVDDGAKFLCLRSTNGTTWTDDTAQVLGGSVSLGGTVFFYRNGNNAFLKVGSAYRFSSDGGANWSAVATEPTALAGGFLQRNGNDPSRLVASLYHSSLFVSTDSGKTWVNRTAASGAASSDFRGGVAYLGTTILACSATGTLRRSNDDGASWAAVAWPQSALGVPLRVMADGFRFYIITSSGQLLTTLDGNTVLARSGGMPKGLAAAVSLNSSITLFVEELGTSGVGDTAFTLDGGVTIQRAQVRSSAGNVSAGHSNGVAVTVAGKSYFVGGSDQANGYQLCYVVDVSDLQAGGAIFRSTTASILPIRSNMAAYVRVL